MKKLLLLSIIVGCLSLVCIPLSAEGANWKLYFINQAKQEFYIETNSIVCLKDGKVRAWNKNTDSKGEFHLMFLNEVDCAVRMYTLRACEPVNSNNIKDWELAEVVMKTWITPEGKQDWNYIGTSDYDEAMFETWCKESKLKK